MVVVEGDEGVDGRFVHVYDGSEFALVGVEYAVASKTLPRRKQFIFFAEVGCEHVCLATNEWLRRLFVGDTIELEDERVATFASPIEYAERYEDVINAEDKESSFCVIPILVGCKALNLTAFAMRAGDVANGYYLFSGDHMGSFKSFKG